MARKEDQIRLAQIKELVDERLYNKAYGLLKDVNPKAIKSTNDMKNCAEVYAKTEHYDEARELYERLYKKELLKYYLQQLIYVCIKSEDFESASQYYMQFVKASKSQRDNLILHYRIEKARGGSYDSLISILEDLKKQEYMEEWAYELAKLYQMAGRIDDCRKECENIKTWFGKGEIVERAQVLLAYLEVDENLQEYRDKDYTIKEEAPNPMDTGTIPPLDPTILKRQRIQERERKRRLKEDKEAFLIADAEEGYIYDEILDKEAEEYAKAQAAKEEEQKLKEELAAKEAKDTPQADGEAASPQAEVQSAAGIPGENSVQTPDGQSVINETIVGYTPTEGESGANIQEQPSGGQVQPEVQQQVFYAPIEEEEEDDTFNMDELNALHPEENSFQDARDWKGYDNYGDSEEGEQAGQDNQESQNFVEGGEFGLENGVGGGEYIEQGSFSNELGDPADATFGQDEGQGLMSADYTQTDGVSPAGMSEIIPDPQSPVEEEVPTYSIEQQERFIRESQSGTGITKDLSKEINAIISAENSSEPLTASRAVEEMKIAENTMELAGNVQEVLSGAGIEANASISDVKYVSDAPETAQGAPMGMSEISAETEVKESETPVANENTSVPYVGDSVKNNDLLDKIMPEPDMPERRQVLPQQTPPQQNSVMTPSEPPKTTNARMGETVQIHGEGTNGTLPESALPTTKALHKRIQDMLTLINGEPEATHYVLVGEGDERVLGVTKKIIRIMNNKSFVSTTNIAQISAKQLNKLDLDQFKTQLKGGCLLVMEASQLVFSTITALFALMDELDGDFVVVLSDEGNTLDMLFKIAPELARRFQYIIDVSKYEPEDYK